jgi:acyl carrier protein
VERVGRQDNFFELGGHSLQGIKLIARIAERFAVRLSVVAVFRYPTVQQMAKAVESSRSVAEECVSSRGAEFEEGTI